MNEDSTKLRRSMRVFADGLIWLDRWREPVPDHVTAKLEAAFGGPLPAEGSDEMYAHAYSRGAFDTFDSITRRFVGTETLDSDEIWKRLNEVHAEMMAAAVRPDVRPKKETP